MKPHVLFPFLIAAAVLTALMLLVMSSASQVAGLPATTETPAQAESGPAEAVTASSAVTATAAVSLPWQVVAPGIDYVELHLQNPINNVYVARMHRDALTVTLETSIASGYLYSDKESVSQMASRYDQAINYWGQAPLTPTWGSRSNVIVAINGSYFDKVSGNPWSGMVQSGWYAKRFDDLGGSSGFGWKLDRSAFIGECVYHRPEKQLITYSDAYSQTFKGINITRTTDSLVVFTPHFDTNTHMGNKGSEVVVQLSRPLLIIPTPRAVTGTITAIYTSTGSTFIPFDSVVLSAKGTAEITMTAHVQVGQVISISQEIKPYRFNCTSPMSQDWGKTYASLSGAFYFLRNNVIRPYADDAGATEQLPRTAIAFNSDYIYFIVVDGRDNWRSHGMSIEELGLFARDTLSATYGISQDGGGSSTMVINGEVKNNTYCNNLFCYAIFLPLAGRGSGAVVQTESDEPLTLTRQIQPNEVDAVTAERYVANGIMMVLVEPMQVSTALTPTQNVVTAVRIDLRLGPGSNYGSLADIAKNTPGVIVAHPMDGVLAKGAFWWKVDFNGVQGWVKESDLDLVLDSWR
jgi:hypothetical protein